MNLPFLLRDVGSQLKRHWIASILFGATFVIGILVGMFIRKPAAIEVYYLDYCDNYIYRIFSEAPGGIFVDRILSSLFFLVLALPAALSVFCTPLQGILVFYRGFVFGSVTVILFPVYRFTGFLVWLIVLLPQTLLFAATYLVLSVLAFDCGWENHSRRDFCGMKKFFVYLIVAVVAALLCALLEFLIVCLIFRPFSKVL